VPNQGGRYQGTPGSPLPTLPPGGNIGPSQNNNGNPVIVPVPVPVPTDQNNPNQTNPNQTNPNQRNNRNNQSPGK
jgi:hypothetical protein